MFGFLFKVRLAEESLCPKDSGKHPNRRQHQLVWKLLRTIRPYRKWWTIRPTLPILEDLHTRRCRTRASRIMNEPPPATDYSISYAQVNTSVATSATQRGSEKASLLRPSGLVTSDLCLSSALSSTLASVNPLHFSNKVLCIVCLTTVTHRMCSLHFLYTEKKCLHHLHTRLIYTNM